MSDIAKRPDSPRSLTHYSLLAATFYKKYLLPLDRSLVASLTQQYAQHVVTVPRLLRLPHISSKNRDDSFSFSVCRNLGPARFEFGPRFCLRQENTEAGHD